MIKFLITLCFFQTVAFTQTKRAKLTIQKQEDTNSIQYQDQEYQANMRAAQKIYDLTITFNIISCYAENIGTNLGGFAPNPNNSPPNFFYAPSVFVAHGSCMGSQFPVTVNYSAGGFTSKNFATHDGTKLEKCNSWKGTVTFTQNNLNIVVNL